ncbi:O-antigen ligase [Gloeocapsa sp. PCC 73106]|uniref:O-antigen ligase family protein n=1 Tax=Gloeocapsa sp. PCC 73106 TaxID=102232 RepID=UPI0002AC39EA|nr:O-antigen ligase family protein [Gloeocapsa sp. PCC 73106]ELR99479.1 lipid A core-O-antigen ligase-like enyme [Gloeocapsa sp. PCC 73106]
MLGTSLNTWRLVLLSLLLLPLIPSLGEVGLVIVLLLTLRGNYRSILSHRYNWAIALVSLGLIVSACFAANPQEAGLGLANLLPFLAILAVYPQLFSKLSQLRQVAWILVIPSGPVVLLGWLQLYLKLSIPYLLGWELIPEGNPTGRMASVFIYANILAIYLLIVFCLNLGLWLESYRSKSKELIWLSFNLILVLSGLILTSSRNAWAIACLIALIVAFYLGWRWLVWLAMGLVGIVLWASFGPAPGRQFWRRYVPSYIWARLSDEMYSDRPVETLRQTQWQFSWDLVLERPWLGWGLRNFTILYKEQMGVWLGHPHNLYLMLMAETGIPITLALAALVAWVLVQSILVLPYLSEGKIIFLSYLMAFTACILFNSLDVSLFDLRVNTITWILLAAIAGIVYHRQITV